MSEKEISKELTLSEKLLEGIPAENLQDWLEEKKETFRDERTVEGFEVVQLGDVNPEKEISLVKIKVDGMYPQHIHKNSDAVFIIISGKGLLLTGNDTLEIKAGDKIEIPRGMPHGFKLSGGEELEFLSVQSPPIKNSETGEEDFHKFDLKDLI